MTVKVIELGKKPYQSPDASVYTDKDKVAPLETFTIYGKNFTSFKKRGNPGVAVMLDDRPLTGSKVGFCGDWKITLKMPPFPPGKHTIDVFGITCEIEIVATQNVILDQKKLKEIRNRDFIIDPNCHMMLSDVRYRVVPLALLKNYLANNDVKNKKYIAEWFDCDDFSDALHGQFTYDTYGTGYAHGELWVETESYGHAINVFIVSENDGEPKAVVVEPQNGTIFDFPKTWNAFLVKI